MDDYEAIRQQFRPNQIKFLLIGESPPPPADIQSSRQFYYAERIRRDDRLFVNTIKALYKEAADQTEAEIEPQKKQWLTRLKQDGVYMIEALAQSQVHEVTKGQRQDRIAAVLPDLIKRIKELADTNTKIILIKSNVFEVAAEPLRKAELNVLNHKLVDYPGQYNQAAYRQKLRDLVVAAGWDH